MSDIDIFADYDEQASGGGMEQFDAAIEGLSTDQLTELRDRIEERDPETLEFLGVEDDGADGDLSLRLKKKR